jgi:hypothetical protein
LGGELPALHGLVEAEMARPGRYGARHGFVRSGDHFTQKNEYLNVEALANRAGSDLLPFPGQGENRPAVPGRAYYEVSPLGAAARPGTCWKSTRTFSPGTRTELLAG